MHGIHFDYSYALIDENELQGISSQVLTAHHLLHNRSGAGSEFTGWVDYPKFYQGDELSRIKEVAARIRTQSQLLIVIGIGGSYLGARAVVEALGHTFQHLLAPRGQDVIPILYAGNNISGKYMSDLMEVVKDRDFTINVISKSGTTTEPAIAFRVLREALERRYGKDGARSRIYVTTDKEKGALKKLALAEGYESFTIPDDIGGRYSVLTPVGLLPIAVAGIDIDQLLEGAKEGVEEYANPNLERNASYQYAALRNILYRKGLEHEILVNYEPSMHYFSEWWKQLFGESEGKDGKGIFPSSVDFSTDLHSIGQIIQDGRRNKFETIIQIEDLPRDVLIEEDPQDIDGLNFLANRSFNDVNSNALQGALLAHVDGGIPNLVIRMPKLNAFYLGKLIYFFKKACGISGYMNGVNPFDQPGVEAYKRNMFALLGKPGFEELQRELLDRLL